MSDKCGPCSGEGSIFYQHKGFVKCDWCRGTGKIEYMIYTSHQTPYDSKYQAVVKERDAYRECLQNIANLDLLRFNIEEAQDIAQQALEKG